MSKVNKLIICLITFLIILFIKNISYSYSVGEVINLSENDLTARSDAYCVALDKKFGGVSGMSTRHPFRIVKHVKIEGNKSTDDNGVVAESESNAILAAILAGPLEKGYGSYRNYKPAQQALYVFWDTWIADVGSSKYGLYDFAHNSGNSGKSPGANAAFWEQVARNYISDGTKCSVDIYFLRYCGPLGEGAIQELIIAVPGNVEIPPDIKQYDGYIIISGKVWEDGEAGKSNDINGKYDSNDKTLSGIKVTLKDKDGKEFSGGSSTTTDESGNYKIVVNYDSSKNVYKLYDNPETVKEKLYNGAYVEFEYDGIKYTTVSTDSSGEDTSKASEDESKRIEFDNNHTVINPGTNTTNQMLTATTKNVISSFGKYSDTTTETQTVTTWYCNADGSKTTTSSTPPQGTYSKTNPDGAWLDIVTESGEMHEQSNNGYWDNDYTSPKYDDEGNPTGEYEQKYINPTEWTWCSQGHSILTTTITNLHIQNVNLGLFKREHPDIALTSDIQKVEVIMKHQLYTYEYGNRGLDNPSSMQVQFGKKYSDTYTRPVNPADIAYVNQNGRDDLEVQVTYKVLFKNQSNTLPVTVRELINYYDLDYTIVECKVGDSAKENTGQSQGPNCYTTIFNNLDIVINPQESATLTIKYNISQSAIKGLLNQNATLNNVVEIYSYSTQYGSNTLCAGQRTAEAIGKVGFKYAGVDIDSQPGNANVYYDQSKDRLDVTDTSYQDDTDIAPSFLLVKDPEYKILSGNIWEDTATNSSLANNERIGDGIKGDENVVANVKVELLKVKEDGTTEPAYLYTAENGTAGRRLAITYTDSYGDYSFGNNKNDVGQQTYIDKNNNPYQSIGKEGVVTDNYIIKFTYGDDENVNNGESTINHIDDNGNIASSPINARNYKSTIVIEPIKSVIADNLNTNDKWHLSLNNNPIISVAVDDLTERANVDKSLKNSNFEEPHSISAYTKPFKMQVEFTKDPNAKVNGDGTPIGVTFEKNLSVFNFGIIERPRENLVIDKTISNLKITLANGQILIDGDPYKDDLDYVKALGNTITSRDVRVRDKLVSIEIDTELIHGAKIDMTYAIKATNNSEHDYDYEQGDWYYYYGEKEKNGVRLPLATTTIEKVVDYVDDELTVTTDGENSDWTIVNWKDLHDGGYLSDELNPEYSTKPDKVIENKNYTILTTEAFKNVTTEQGNNSKTIYMHVSKLLGNQENEYTYENHVEIIQIGGKIARTIKEVDDDGTQVEKKYVPGDYKPTDASRVHEPDDDRIITRITPPTGLLDNIGTYIVILTISLVVIGVGTYIIKKKVLGK